MTLLKRWTKRAAYRVAPSWTEEMDQRWWLISQAKAVRRDFERGRPLEDCVDGMLTHSCFVANQKRTELLGLLRMVQALQPRRICEIGSAGGGTLSLFTLVAP